MNQTATARQEFPVILLDVVETGARSKKNWLRCEIDSHVTFNTTDLETYCFARWEPVIFDVMLLAAAVEIADRTQRRPLLLWQRDIALRLPVHDPDHWNASPVRDTLLSALTLLTGDNWSIEFYARRHTFQRPGQIPLQLPANVNAVIPFSDGMDSRAVAGLMHRKLGDTLVRIRLGTKDYDGRFPFSKIPYKLKPPTGRFVESTARSRGVKFAVISGLTAYLAKAEQVIVPESGQGALGPSLVTVGQTHEDYRNHPLFTTRMECFWEALLGHKVRYQFPRLWHTKAETLRAFVESCDDGATWDETHSCWQDNRHVSVDKERRHCGICAACLLRRLAVHGAGLRERRDTYVWENLRAASFEAGAADGFAEEKITQKLREYAIAGVLHLDHLAGLSTSASNAQVLNLHAFQLGRALGISQPEARKKLDRLLHQHDIEWKAFVKSLGSKSFITDWALHAS
jgi:7-cyano-7-deazaguanine synthase in queuosine biosynthesis